MPRLLPLQKNTHPSTDCASLLPCFTVASASGLKALTHEGSFLLQAFYKGDATNRKDLAAAERFWSPSYIQHSAHVPPGREGLFELVAAGAPDLRYECQLAVAEDDFVMFVIQDEAIREVSAGRYPMFGDQFPG